MDSGTGEKISSASDLNFVSVGEPESHLGPSGIGTSAELGGASGTLGGRNTFNNNYFQPSNSFVKQSGYGWIFETDEDDDEQQSLM